MTGQNRVLCTSITKVGAFLTVLCGDTTGQSWQEVAIFCNVKGRVAAPVAPHRDLT